MAGALGDVLMPLCIQRYKTCTRLRLILRSRFAYYVVALDSGQKSTHLLSFCKRSLCWRKPKRSLVTRVMLWDVEEGST